MAFAADGLDISLSELKQRKGTSPKIQQTLMETDEFFLNVCEYHLFVAIIKGENWASSFLLNSGHELARRKPDKDQLVDLAHGRVRELEQVFLSTNKLLFDKKKLVKKIEKFAKSQGRRVVLDDFRR